METKILKLNEIVEDKKFYPREQYNWQTGYSYSQNMKSGSKFPPIVVVVYKGKYYLIDGKHRKEAYKINKVEFVEVEILTGLNEKQIYEEAVRRNITHGQQFSPFEKRKIILRLQELDYLPDEISNIVMIPLDKMKAFVYDKVTFDFTTGKPIVLKSAFSNMSGGTLQDSSTFENIQDDYNFGEQQVSLLRQLNSILENRYINLKNKNVVIELKKLKDLIKGIDFKNLEMKKKEMIEEISP